MQNVLGRVRREHRDEVSQRQRTNDVLGLKRVFSGNNAANGLYDDGYVRVDNTGDAGGYTSYWGYDNASQISGSTLTMHSATSYTGSGSGSGNNSPYAGLELAYGDSYWYWGKAKIGWELGFGFLPISISETESGPASIAQTAFRFALPPSTPNGPYVPPTAPYSGGPSGLGALIQTNYTTTNSVSSGNFTSKETLNVFLYTLRVGPTLYWDVTDRIGLYAGAGPVVGLVAGSLDYNDTLSVPGGSVAHNSGRIHGAAMSYGGYVNATVVYHVVKGGQFYAGVQFMPMKGASISGSGREAKLDLTGQMYFAVGVNWPF